MDGIMSDNFFDTNLSSSFFKRSAIFKSLSDVVITSSFGFIDCPLKEISLSNSFFKSAVILRELEEIGPLICFIFCTAPNNMLFKSSPTFILSASPNSGEGNLVNSLFSPPFKTVSFSCRIGFVFDSCGATISDCGLGLLSNSEFNMLAKPSIYSI